MVERFPPGVAGVVLAVLLAPGARAEPLRFADDLGHEVPGIEVCFWSGPARECSEPAPGEGVPWPVRASALRAEGPGHGPVWIEPAERPVGGLVVLPRKAALTVSGVPAGARLDFYRARDPVFRVPLETLQLVDPARSVLVPAGPIVLAGRSAPPGARSPSGPRADRADRRAPLPGARPAPGG